MEITERKARKLAGFSESELPRQHEFRASLRNHMQLTRKRRAGTTARRLRKPMIDR